MDPEIKQLIEQDLEIDIENNKILKKIDLSRRISNVVSSIKWLVIIASVLGVTFWLGPTLEATINTYRDLLNR